MLSPAKVLNKAVIRSPSLEGLLRTGSILRAIDGIFL